MTDARDAHFDNCEADHFGWDGYHVEDAVTFARAFRAERDDARANVAALTAALREAQSAASFAYGGVVGRERPRGGADGRTGPAAGGAAPLRGR